MSEDDDVSAESDAWETTGAPEPKDEGDDELSRLADEGMLIAESALRMRVKNRIVMQVLGRGEPLTTEAVGVIVEEEADDLIVETRAAAEYLRKTHDEVDRFGFGGPKGTYGRDDLKLLDLRRRVDEELVARLERGRDDPAYRSAMVDEARTEAMNEMFRARMMPPPPRGPKLSPKERAERMREVAQEVGLAVAEHVREQRRKARAEERKAKWSEFGRRFRVFDR